MRDDELRRLLVETNPWWRSAGPDRLGWTAQHRLLRERAHYDLGYRSPILADLVAVAGSDTLVVLTGPRRIGKSVVVIDFAATLCERGHLDPRAIIHLPCDGMTTRDLRRALTIGRDLTSSLDRSDADAGRRVWLLDEVGEVGDWTAIIKSARDQTRFGDDTVVLTSSKWTGGAAVAGSLLAGRAGSAATRRVRVLLPMRFRDYLAATRPALPRPGPVHLHDLQGQEAKRLLDDLRVYVEDYDLAWQNYLTSGGFPRAVAEHHNTGEVSQAYLRDLHAWLHADVDPDGPQQSTTRLIEALAQRANSPLNVTSTAEHLGLSRSTLSRRLDRLISSFAAIWCPQRAQDGQRTPGSQAKLYLADPLLSWLPTRLLAGAVGPDMTRLTEMVVGVAEARAIDQLEEGRWLEGETIGYVRTGSGNEIDLAPVPVSVAGARFTTTPVESKWVDQGWRSQAKVIETKYAAGVLATKSILDLNHPAWAVPAPLLTLLLN